MGELKRLSYDKKLRTFSCNKQELFLNLFRLIAAITMIQRIIDFHLIKILCCLSLILITFIPAIIQHFTSVRFNFSPVMICVLFSYGAIYIGSVQGAYITVPSWDVIIHTLSGVIFMILCLMLSIITFDRLNASVPLWIHFLLAFTMTSTIGMFWEIYEFSVDSLFGMNTQHTQTGVVDTMQDFLCNTTGALVSSLVFHYSLVKNKFKPIRNIFIGFFKANNIDFKA